LMWAINVAIQQGCTVFEPFVYPRLKTFGFLFRPCVFNGLRFPKDLAEKTANYEQSQPPDASITHLPGTEHSFR
jgi:hypothetical protein